MCRFTNSAHLLILGSFVVHLLFSSLLVNMLFSTKHHYSGTEWWTVYITWLVDVLRSLPADHSAGSLVGDGIARQRQKPVGSVTPPTTQQRCAILKTQHPPAQRPERENCPGTKSNVRFFHGWQISERQLQRSKEAPIREVWRWPWWCWWWPWWFCACQCHQHWSLQADQEKLGGGAVRCC